MKILVNEGFPDIEIVINCPKLSDDISNMVKSLQCLDKKLLGVKEGVTGKRYTYNLEEYKKKII